MIDVKKLSKELGVTVVETAAIKGEGTKELVEAAKKAAKGRQGSGSHQVLRHR